MYYYFMIKNKIFECICHKDKNLGNLLDLGPTGALAVLWMYKYKCLE